MKCIEKENEKDRTDYSRTEGQLPEEKRECNRGNIWRNNDWEFSKTDGKYQPIDWKSSVHPKENKYK